jgi:ElaB/YqjD/DUF883 family membrane-anchored ribosome-binding protein
MKNTPRTDAPQDMTDRVAAQVEGTAAELAERGREASRAVRDVADNFGTALDRSLARQPMTTLAMAVGVGFVLGALWKA